MKELGNIGTSHAATALSMLLNCRVDCRLPSLSIVPGADMSQVCEKPDEVLVGIYQRLLGGLSGSLVLLLARESALQVINQMLQPERTAHVFGEIERSVLEEVGNILNGSYVTALSEMTRLSVLPSVPKFVVDSPKIILDSVVSGDHQGRVPDQILLIKTGFFLNDRDLQGTIFFFPESGSVKLLLDALGIQDLL